MLRILLTWTAIWTSGLQKSATSRSASEGFRAPFKPTAFLAKSLESFAGASGNRSTGGADIPLAGRTDYDGEAKINGFQVPPSRLAIEP